MAAFVIYVIAASILLAAQVYIKLRYQVGAFYEKEFRSCSEFPENHAWWPAILISVAWPLTAIPWGLVTLVLIMWKQTGEKP